MQYVFLLTWRPLYSWEVSFTFCMTCNHKGKKLSEISRKCSNKLIENYKQMCCYWTAAYTSICILPVLFFVLETPETSSNLPSIIMQKSTNAVTFNYGEKSVIHLQYIAEIFSVFTSYKWKDETDPKVIIQKVFFFFSCLIKAGQGWKSLNVTSVNW